MVQFEEREVQKIVEFEDGYCFRPEYRTEADYKHYDILVKKKEEKILRHERYIQYVRDELERIQKLIEEERIQKAQEMEHELITREK